MPWYVDRASRLVCVLRAPDCAGVRQQDNDEQHQPVNADDVIVDEDGNQFLIVEGGTPRPLLRPPRATPLIPCLARLAAGEVLDNDSMPVFEDDDDDDDEEPVDDVGAYDDDEDDDGAAAEGDDDDVHEDAVAIYSEHSGVYWWRCARVLASADTASCADSVFAVDARPVPQLDGSSRVLAVSGGGDDLARVWDPTTGDTLYTLTGHKDSVVDVREHPATP